MRFFIERFRKEVPKRMKVGFPLIYSGIGGNGLKHVIDILPLQWIIIFVSKYWARLYVFFCVICVEKFLKFPD